MAAALRPGQPQGFARRRSLSSPQVLTAGAATDSINSAIEAVYRQLLNRVPLTAERLSDAESQLRDGQLSLAEFVGVIAGSDLFVQRLNRMAPLRAAAATYLALLGRAAMPNETSRFLSTRVRKGLRTAIDAVLSSDEYSQVFGQSTVPYIRGLSTADGVPLSTVNRTANLYAGNAGLTPKPGESI